MVFALVPFGASAVDLPGASLARANPVLFIGGLIPVCCAIGLWTSLLSLFFYRRYCPIESGSYFWRQVRSNALVSWWFEKKKEEEIGVKISRLYDALTAFGPLAGRVVTLAAVTRFSSSVIVSAVCSGVLSLGLMLPPLGKEDRWLPLFFHFLGCAATAVGFYFLTKRFAGLYWSYTGISLHFLRGTEIREQSAAESGLADQLAQLTRQLVALREVVTKAAPRHRIDFSLATEEQLLALKEIGEATKEQIIEGGREGVSRLKVSTRKRLGSIFDLDA